MEEFDDAVRVRRTGDILPLKINTMPHPGFPTDMQPLMGVLLSVAKGTSPVTESVWDNRFRYEMCIRDSSLPEEMRPMARNICESFQTAAARLLSLGLGSVSYTHLDVYKRQMMEFTGAPSTFSV